MSMVAMCEVQPAAARKTKETKGSMNTCSAWLAANPQRYANDPRLVNRHPADSGK